MIVDCKNNGFHALVPSDCGANGLTKQKLKEVIGWKLIV
jgi:hypothetical protein